MKKAKIGFILATLFFICAIKTVAAQSGPDKNVAGQSIVVNGDIVEYSTDSKEVTATGNVSVTYRGTKLTCERLTVNTSTKDAKAEGRVRIEDEKGVIEGLKVTYNFQDNTGTILDAQFKSRPYFGRAEKINRVNDAEFIALDGYATTCSFDNPHYRIRSKKIDFFTADKIRTEQDAFYVGQAPVLYLPRYNHSLKDPLMHVQVVPGKSKDWGAYLLTASRYNLTDNISGRIYLDYRSKFGMAEGFGTNYNTSRFGRGDFKYYYTQERPRDIAEGNTGEFQRYLIRLRHKWDIDKQTVFVSEYYRVTDSKRAALGSQYNFLKDYFSREYEKDAQPLSYALLHHNFSYSSMDFLVQKRTNRWYSQLEKLPEIKYSLPDYRLGDTPFYFGNNTQAANFNQKNAVPSPASSDVDLMRLDTTNKFSLPMGVAFIKVTPFVMNRETFYDKDVYGSAIAPRTVFYTGTDISSKFYRIFDVKSNFLGMDINGLRHIITPTIEYSYNHEPTIPSSKLRQIDAVDAVNQNNSAALELSNKLKTKRKGQSVDLAELRVNSSYVFKPNSGNKRGSNLSDILFDLKFLPYSWLRIDADAIYSRSGNRSDTNYNHFSNVNYDVNFNLAEERSFSIGQRYQKKGGNEITSSFDWRLNPKWRCALYHRYNMGRDPALKRGLREQEYIISRDLHCWALDLSYNLKQGEGASVWFTFRLKAFPELGFELNQSYYQPKSGSQINP